MVGDGNTVALGYGWLQLTRHTKSLQPGSQLQQLIPYNRSTTLVGREFDLADLRRFAESELPIAVRVLTGSGGAGKTRLALDLCDQLAREGWDSGFVGEGDQGVEGGELRRFVQAQNLSTWDWRKPTFVVVDYAAGHANALAAWIAALARRDAPDPTKPASPLRLLLLERHGQRGSGWWADVFGGGAWADIDKQALLDPIEPVALAPLVHAAARAALMNEVLAANVPAGKAALQVDEALVTKYVSAASWGGDPLFLMMAALYAVDVGHTHALALPRSKLAHALAAREATRLTNMAIAHRPGVSAALARHLAACVTLAGGMTRSAFIAFARAEKLAAGHDAGADPAVLADLLSEALPAAQLGSLAPILPDLIGEAFVAVVCKDQSFHDIQRWRDALGLPVLQSLVRCAQDFADNDDDFPLPQLGGWCDAIRTDEHALSEFDPLIPTESVALRALNLRVAQYRTEAALSNPSTEPARRAHHLALLGVALANMGEREKALAAAQEEVTLRRALSAQRPDAFNPNLAASLNNLASFVSALGEREKALAAAQEAVTLYRALAAQRPDAFNPDLASSLSNLSNRLSALGDHEKALAAAQEGVSLRRALTAQHPDAFNPDLAMSLNNLASFLSELGEREKALAAALEAVTLRRALSAQRPDAFNPDLAMSLNNLANRLSDLGDREKALAAAQEAVALYRALSAQRPDAFIPDLATSLNNLANLLSTLVEREKALTTAQEAVMLNRGLAAQRPDVFAQDLAKSLAMCGLSLADMERLPEAAAAFAEAVEALAFVLARYPTAIAPLMRQILSDYLCLCERAETEPDRALLAPVLQVFEQMKSSTPDQGAPK